MAAKKLQGAGGLSKDVAGGKKTASGREVWHIKNEAGRLGTVATSKTSLSAMDEAVSIYGDALKRLATR